MDHRNQLASVTTFQIALANSSLDSALAAKEIAEIRRHIEEAKSQLTVLLDLGESAAAELRKEKQADVRSGPY